MFHPIRDLLHLLLCALIGINRSESGLAGCAGIWALAGGFCAPFWCQLAKFSYLLCSPLHPFYSWYIDTAVN